MAYTKQNFKSGQTLTAEHLNKIEQGIVDASSGGGVSSWNDFTDKPFGTEIGEAQLLDDVRVTFEDGQAIIQSIGLVAGKTYTVGWMSGEFNCVAVQANESMVVIGNFGVFGGDDTGEPFVIMDAPSEGAAVMMSLDGSTSAFVRIAGEAELVHPLDAKFVPDGMVKIVDFVMSANGVYRMVVKRRRVSESDDDIDTSHIYNYQKRGYQIIGRLEVDNSVIFYQLCASTLDNARFMAFVPHADGMRVQEFSIANYTVSHNTYTLAYAN